MPSYQSPPTAVKPLPWDENRRGWLALASFEGFGSRTLHKLRQHCARDGERAYRVTSKDLRALGCTEQTLAKFSVYQSSVDVEDLKRRIERNAIQFLLFDDEAYPALLKQIADPPLALFVRSATSQLSSEFDGVALVGTRSMSPYGRSVTAWLARDLAQTGYAIVSGLAGGIDTVAHEAGVDAGGTCVAVLGSGVDDASLYPRCNLGLARRIMATTGALISEFPPGTESKKHHFPLRNRIISGLCRATIVVEAGEKSGSLITAHLALEQNREVFAVPGSVLNAQSHGTNHLLRLGAIPCTTPQDVIDVLTNHVPPAPTSGISIAPEEQAIMELLAHPMHVNDIARALHTSVAIISGRIVGLELKGLVLPQGGQNFARTRYWKPTQD